VKADQLRFEDIPLPELVQQAQRAKTILQPTGEPIPEDPSGVAGSRSDELIRRAVAAAESRVIRRAIEAARRAQQQRLFASLGRR
jgi:hypothetical protein